MNNYLARWVWKIASLPLRERQAKRRIAAWTERGRKKSQDQGFVLFSVLLILSLLALIFSGLVSSLESFLALNHSNQIIQESWVYAQESFKILKNLNIKNLNYTNSKILFSNPEIINSQNSRDIKFHIFNQNQLFQSQVFIQKFAENTYQITWETGTKIHPNIIIQQVFISNDVWGKTYVLRG